MRIIIHKPKVSFRVIEEDSEGQWVTINGVHILIKDGETGADAFKRVTSKDLSTDDDIQIGKTDIARQSQVKDRANKLIRDLPSDNTKGLKIESRDDLGNAKAKGFEQYKVAAQFEPDEFTTGKGRLVISSHMADSSDEQFKTTVYHEVGHHTYRQISVEAKQSWFRVWATEKMPTRYASVNESEGFAENYAFINAKKTISPSVNKWFKKYVGVK
jgi:hypothetical protein